jgi:hypothetical protein
MLRIAIHITMFAGVALSQISSPIGVSSGDSVLSIRGVCQGTEIPPLDLNGCTVVITRQQFEDLMSIVAPDGQATASMKQSFAKTYAEFLAFSSAARDSGIDSSAQYRETIQWLRLKTLAELFRRRLEKESNVVSDTEMEAYYRERISQFEEVKLQRLVVPRSNFAAPDKQKFELDAQRIAVGLRERAGKGEDLERLQKEAYEALGFNGQPPSTSVGNRRRASLPAEVGEEVFSLKPGEVSQVEKETYSFVIYKVEAKWTLPENQVRREISREISHQKLERVLKSITGNIRTELNETYFGTVLTQ